MNKENASASWPSGIKRTRQRELVYNALSCAKTPLSALDISDRLDRAKTPVWLSTIYRILDMFTAQGIAQKSAVTESGMAVFELSANRHRHYAVCISCQRVIAIENCPFESFSPKLSERDFQVTGHRLQIYGYCTGCSPKS